MRPFREWLDFQGVSVRTLPVTDTLSREAVMKYFVPVVFVLFCSLPLVGCAKRPLMPAAPWTDAVNDSLGFFTTSTDPGDLSVCYVFDWGDGSTTTTGYFASGDTGYCAHGFDDTRVHYIRVRARNEKGSSSGWSPSLCFRQTHPPQLADTMTGLRRWAVGRWYHTSVRVTDPDADSVAVKFIWDDSLTTGWSALIPSGSTICDSCKWSTMGPHAVRVALKDKGCTVSCPSEIKTVNVSQMAILWGTYDEETYYDATPTLGTIDGEPVLYCGVCDVVDCRTLDGRLRWSTPIPDGYGYAPSLSADGSRLYLTDYDSGLVCLDSRTGRRVWILDTCFGSYTPALGPDGAIYVVTSSSCVYGLQRIRDYGDSAAVQWTTPLGDYGYVDNGAVVGRDGTVYATGYDAFAECSFLEAVDSGGTVLWKDSARMHWGGTPVIDSRGRLLVADLSGGLYCLNPDGTLAWSASTGELDPGSIAIGQNDEVIVTDNAGWVTKYGSDGQRRWTSNFRIYGGNTSCVVQDSTVISFDPGGSVYCIDKDGQTLWEFSIRDSLGIDKQRLKRLEGQEEPSAVIGPDGDLYLAADYGLVCIAHGGLKMANTAWPTYNHDNAHSGWAGRQQR
jgi:hypothetical protein